MHARIECMQVSSRDYTLSTKFLNDRRPKKFFAEWSCLYANYVKVITFVHVKVNWFYDCRRKTMWLLINIIHEKHNYNNKFWQREGFSSFSWLAETDNYLCQIQTFSRPTLSKSILAYFQVLSWMILKALVLKKFEFDKGNCLFQPISWIIVIRGDW